jgi:hypothetical protein
MCNKKYGFLLLLEAASHRGLPLGSLLNLGKKSSGSCHLWEVRHHEIKSQ